MFARYATFGALFLLAACAGPREPIMEVKRIGYDQLAGWSAEAHGEALVAFKLSCEAILAKEEGAKIGKGKIASTAGQWRAACEQALLLPEDNHALARQFFEHYFTPFQISDEDNFQGLFTGYYEPELNGSKQRTERFSVPVYGMPTDVESGVQYYSREEIEAGALRGKAPVLAWVDDPIDLFFLHIQGSGRVRLPDGSIERIGYAGQNGHEYVAIGKILIDQNEIAKENMSMQAIKSWLREHPGQAKQLMQENPSYVFLKRLEGGIKGAAGVDLTPARSLAVDHRFIPYGTPIFIQTTLPETPMHAERDFYQLLIAQDTGGAIKGVVRGDVFFGAGEEAAHLAGFMKQPGTAVVLIPNAAAQSL